MEVKQKLSIDINNCNYWDIKIKYRLYKRNALTNEQIKRLKRIFDLINEL